MLYSITIVSGQSIILWAYGLGIVLVMDSMQELLGRYSPKEPPEIVAIRQYVYDNFHMLPSVGIQGEALIVTVSSSSLANTLRFHVAQMQQAAQTSKRIVLRIV